MTVKILRRGSAKCIGLLSAFITILICLYYISIGQPSFHSKNLRANRIGDENSNLKLRSKKLPLNKNDQNGVLLSSLSSFQKTKSKLEDCYSLTVRDTNITALDEYSKFEFQPEWMRTKEYWDKGFEDRYEQQMKDPSRLPLKVFVVPHSHNDPGWLKTFTNYFQSDSRQILNSIIAKMQDFKDMTFIWSEISFLQLWWEQAHPTKQRALKRLIKSGRFEITTGGWVMTDEANVHLFPMIDQLIEGHQWLKANLNYTPEVGWSIDPFGHGSTVPYLLSSSGFKGTIIQRIHYAWKQWFAKHQAGDFLWMPTWKTMNDHAKKYALLTHNMPFDIYSIKHSCGPHPFICLNFDFRKIPGEYTEYSIKAQFITDENVAEKAKLLLEQYSRTASLFPHNVALIPVGDDFRYNKEKEIEQQYTNYKKLIDHINANKDLYKTEISFGTPKDYFNEIKKRIKNFPTFKGDFFVYSDIFSEGRPAYWSGYFTTRPSYKILSTELEHNLRSAEILFTFAYNYARQHRLAKAIKIFEKNYEKMILARRNLGLFQHHDAITGTSKAAVMRDYGMRLFDSIQDTIKMQGSTIEALIQNGTEQQNFLLSEIERDSFNKLPRKTPITFNNGDNDINSSLQKVSFIVFNSLLQERYEVITLRSTLPNVAVIDSNGNQIPIQINPVWNITENEQLVNDNGNTQTTSDRIRVSSRQYEILFIAKLPPLSLLKYTLVKDENYKERLATIYCNNCNGYSTTNDENTSGGTNDNEANTSKNKKDETIIQSIFNVKQRPRATIQLENSKLRLEFDGKTGFLKSLIKLKTQPGKVIPCAIKFFAYKSAQFHSGAYLFKVDPNNDQPQQQNGGDNNGGPERNVLEQYNDDIHIIITSGPLSSDVTVIYGTFLAHTVRIYKTNTPLDNAIYIENDIDFESPPKNRETELFIRFVTDIENYNSETVNDDGSNDDNDDAASTLPEFYSDQNGFLHQKRRLISAIGIEGNYYPITSSAFIQDKNLRLTVITQHAQGAASLESGQLEIMLDRRTLYDDYRGMGEGIIDSRLTRHKFWLIIENQNIASKQQKSSKTSNLNENTEKHFNVPTLFANHLSNTLRYPANIYYIESLDDDVSIGDSVSNMKLHKPNIINNLNLITMQQNQEQFPCDIHLLNLRTQTDEELPLFPSRTALMIIHRQGYDCQHTDTDDEYSLQCFKMNQIHNDLKLNNLFTLTKIESIKSTSLTGLKKFDTTTSDDRNSNDFYSLINLEPMELRTLNVTFEF